MLSERRNSESNVLGGSDASTNCSLATVQTTHDQNRKSAGMTAKAAASEHDLRSPYFCEENVWRLAYRRLVDGGSSNSCTTATSCKENEEYYVIFISNDERCCPMLYQRASDDVNRPCFWDYHVILIQSSKVVGSSRKHANVVQVLDMDSILSYPCPLDEYLDQTFNLNHLQFKKSSSSGTTTNKYAPKFRVIRAEFFLQIFYSDRMHMYQNGQWNAPPPTYDCIMTEIKKMKVNSKGHLSNLDDFINMEKNKGKKAAPDPTMGDVFTLSELRSKFGL